jgi:hypothetical protein
MAEKSKQNLYLIIAFCVKKDFQFLFQHGVIHTDEKELIVETLTENHPEFKAHHQMSKRESFFDQKTETFRRQHLVIVFESSASGGECGLKTDNLKRMHAPPTKVVRLETSNVDRTKRSTTDAPKMIELAVFVDEVLYASTKKKGTSDPISYIQDIVFTYINSVINYLHKTCLFHLKSFFFFRI